jgi:hypothetical protein
MTSAMTVEATFKKETLADWLLSKEISEGQQ